MIVKIDGCILILSILSIEFLWQWNMDEHVLLIWIDIDLIVKENETVISDHNLK